MSKPIMHDLAAQPQSGDVAEYPYGPRPAVVDVKDLAWPQSVPLRALNPEVQGPVIIAAMFVVFALSNFLLCPLMEFVNSPDGWILVVFVQLGAILAQGGLLSAVLVFGRGSFWLRTACCWAAGLFLWSCWAAGIMGLVVAGRSGWSRDWHEAISFTVLSLPLVALAIQSPLWLARNFLGWRLTRAGASPLPERPLSIGDYLIGTAVVAVSIACARSAPPANWEVSGYWSAWAIVCAYFAGGSALGIIPALLAMFRLRDWRIGLAVLLLYGLVAGLATLAIVVSVFGRPGGPGPIWVMAGLVIMLVSLAAFLAAPMIVARMLGFEFVLGRSQPAASLSGGRSAGTFS